MNFYLTPDCWQIGSLSLLALFIVIAVKVDMRRHRIPNLLVLVITIIGILLNTVGPVGHQEGLLNNPSGALGAGSSLLGALVGLFLFLPLYIKHAFGAGDIKLLAALGSFFGPVDVINLSLFIFISGGVFAIFKIFLIHQSLYFLSYFAWRLNPVKTLHEPRLTPSMQTAHQMPFAPAFAGGLLLYGFWRLRGGAPLIQF